MAHFPVSCGASEAVRDSTAVADGGRPGCAGGGAQQRDGHAGHGQKPFYPTHFLTREADRD